MSLAPTVLLNGEVVSQLPATSRGLHYGDGVFRTLLYRDGAWPLWDRHVDKLRRDAEVLALDAPAAELLREEAERAVQGCHGAALKILLVRSGAERGYRPRTRQADRLIFAFEAPSFPSAHWLDGIRAVRSPLRLSSQPALAGVKHLNRLEQVLASRDWPEGIDEVILRDRDGAPICGSRSNLFWARGGRLFTPDLSRAGVAGVMREAIVDNAAEQGIGVEIVRARWTDLLAADEAFVCNSLIGLWPLREIDGRELRASPGPLSRRMAAAIAYPRLSNAAAAP